MNDISLTDMSKQSFDRTASYILNSSTPDSGARKILLYFYKLNKTMTQYGVMNLGNEYLSKRFNMSMKTFENSLYRAKKTGFLTTTGRGRTRLFFFNQALLEQKMLLIPQQKAEMTSQLSE